MVHKKTDTPKDLEKEVQTDAFLCYPYEHLFDVVWPQPVLDSKESKNFDTNKNPYDILDDYIEHICDKIEYSKHAKNQKLNKQECETAVLKAEIGLLQNQVYLYIYSWYMYIVC